ncbi:MAG: CehA/McbA family metallohydrolase [Acidobacteria bacterium]|nr:CehA/McbA family metallohydrolase [Acidobacteriota bacterium]
MLVAAALLLSSCGEAPEVLSPNAQVGIVATLREDLELERHASDGGGTAVLELGPASVDAGGRGTWTFVYRAGPLGIADGGWLFFQVSPFWNWSTPQVTNPEAPGFTTVATTAAGVELEPETLDRQLLGIHCTGRALEAGEEIRLTYGAGDGPARVDRFAEQRSPFWFAVDGDGDGIRGLLPEPLTVDIVGGPPVRLILTLPSVVRPGEAVSLRAGVTDAMGNQAAMPDTTVTLRWIQQTESTQSPPAGLPGSLSLTAGSTGAELRLAAPESGAFVVEASNDEGLVGWSNPMVVSERLDKILWGDIHGHSNFSDGTGTPEQYFRYARDVAALDFVALTDHDHWGIQPLSQTPALWEEIRRQTAAFHTAGRFVTLLGYEWTSWLHGHRHVLYFDDDGPVLSSIDPRYETPAQLWAALRPYGALTFAHHSAGDPVATNWEYAPDPELEPVTEVVSIHGSSEAADSPGQIRGAIAGNFVRDVLERGYRLGFIGSGDGHDGHPGLSSLANPNGGLAALLTEDLSRQGIYRALKQRRTYATNGVRMVLAVTLDGSAMGSTVAPASAPRLVVDVTGSAPLERLDLIRVGSPVESFDLPEQPGALFERTLATTASGDVIYVRVLQRDGGVAWSSPFFVDASIR